MKKQIRFGVWETNSSSVNTLTVMTAEEYDDMMKNKWDSDDWLWDIENEEWVERSTLKDEDLDEYWYVENPCERGDRYFDIETTRYTTKHGDEIVAVSVYGYDG